MAVKSIEGYGTPVFYNVSVGISVVFIFFVVA